MSQLKKALYAAYDGFADKRVKNLAKSSTFIVDDRAQGDYGADRSLFLWFCSIFVDVVSESEVTVRLAGGVPTGPSVTAWVKANGGRYKATPSKVLTFTVKQGNESALLSLATAIESIVTSGKPYSVASYKYVCPRTANSLKRLANELHATWDA